MKSRCALLISISLSTMVGCGAEPPKNDTHAVDSQESAFITDNSLTDNSLTDNSLTDNSLTDNSLTDNSLTDNSLTDNALAAIQDPSGQGALNRELLRYIVACALKPDQSFDFSWTDTADAVHDEHYVGQLGLAPEWATGPLDKEGQEWVTACLGAKVNYYGVHVTISVRSGEQPLKLHPFSDELDDFPHIEGAFWGNLWAPQPYMNACYKPSNVNNSRAQQRDCASGHLLPDGTVEECGIINVVGPCSSVCKKFSWSRQYFEDCTQRPGQSYKRTDHVITTALP